MEGKNSVDMVTGVIRRENIFAYWAIFRPKAF